MNAWRKPPILTILVLVCGFYRFATATGCLHVQVVVEDYMTHQPLLAQFYVKTPKGELLLGAISSGTGQFSLDVACNASALIIKKEGYRPQTIILNGASTLSDKSIGLIIPLVSVDQPGIDRPYFQTEQTHFVQTNTEKPTIRPQRNIFVISDAITGQLLTAQTCFFFTKNGQKRCIETTAKGQCVIDFTEKDIIAIEVSAPGYQTYQGNMVVEEADTRQLQHNVQLTRVPTLLSVRLSADGSSCELRQEGNPTKSIRLRAVPGMPNTLVAYDLTPQRYTLVWLDSKQQVLEKRSVQLRTGLNLDSFSGKSPQVSAENGASFLEDSNKSRPDSALRFEQGSYTLLPESKALLTRMAEYLKQHPEIVIKIIGHTDKEGNEQLNRQLSEFRAKVVSTFLGQRGVIDSRMEIVGVGSRFLIAPSDTEENKARNRRVTIEFISK